MTEKLNNKRLFHLLFPCERFSMRNWSEKHMTSGDKIDLLSLVLAVSSQNL